MDIEIIEMAERKARFVLKNSSPAMANALRRTLLMDLPKMAIDKVEFHLGPIMSEDDREYESTTPLFDEVIAHRLGMIPVPTDLDVFVPQSECSCGGVGCPSCSIIYSLHRIGPCTVMSQDLLPLGDPSLKVKDEFIPIVELTDRQAVLIYATAVMGTARTHVKWQVCIGVGY
ncbi:MAG: DNA-directed RNA polymerase subunit D [Candidatus Methanomethylophilaceae archaeon]|nr:DNA-directed RNA polymerase subunit D [Candidatus Methanomethylophilaceae archaeon]